MGLIDYNELKTELDQAHDTPFTEQEILSVVGKDAFTPGSLPSAEEPEPGPEPMEPLYQDTGLTKNQIIQKNMENRSEFTRSLLSGIDETQGLMYGAGGLVGDMFHIDRLRDWGFEGYKRNLEEAAMNPSKFESVSDVDWSSPGDVGTWFAGVLGKLTPTMAEMALTSAIGGTVGTFVEPGGGTVTGAVAGAFNRGVVKAVIRKRIEKTLASKAFRKIAAEAGEEAAQRAAQKAVANAIGSGIGLVVGSTALEAGGNWTESAEKFGVEGANEYTSLGLGLLSGVTELIAPSGKFVRKLLGINSIPRKITKDAAKKLIERAGMGQFIKAMVKATPGTMAKEGAQEFVQELLSTLNMFIQDPEEDLLSPENIHRYIDSAAAGAAAGVLFGLGEGYSSHKSRLKEARETLKQQEERRAAEADARERAASADAEAAIAGELGEDFVNPEDAAQEFSDEDLHAAMVRMEQETAEKKQQLENLKRFKKPTPAQKTLMEKLGKELEGSDANLVIKSAEESARVFEDLLSAKDKTVVRTKTKDAIEAIMQTTGKSAQQAAQDIKIGAEIAWNRMVRKGIPDAEKFQKERPDLVSLISSLHNAPDKAAADEAIRQHKLDEIGKNAGARISEASSEALMRARTQYDHEGRSDLVSMIDAELNSRNLDTALRSRTDSKSRVTTLGGAIRAMGGVNPIGLKTDLLYQHKAAGKAGLFNKSGVEIERAQDALVRNGWMLPSENLADILSQNPETLKRGKLDADAKTKAQKAEAARLEASMESPDTMPPDYDKDGAYRKEYAGDLPEGMKATMVINGKWDKYKVVENNLFDGVVLQDGERIKVDPGQEVEILTSDIKNIEAGERDPGQVYDYSSTQADIKGPMADEIKAFGQNIPDAELYKDPEGGYESGREEKPHITVKYGVHSADPKSIEPALEGVGPFKATMGDVSIFEADDYDVVKVDVDSPELHALNKKIAESTDVTDTFPDYRPHVTIAYVKKGEGKKYIGDTRFKGKEVTIETLTFSGKDGKESVYDLTEQKSGDQGAKPSSPQKETPAAEITTGDKATESQGTGETDQASDTSLKEKPDPREKFVRDIEQKGFAVGPDGSTYKIMHSDVGGFYVRTTENGVRIDKGGDPRGGGWSMSKAKSRAIEMAYPAGRQKEGGLSKKEKALQDYRDFVNGLTDEEVKKAGDLIVSDPEFPASQLNKIKKAIAGEEESSTKSTPAQNNISPEDAAKAKAKASAELADVILKHVAGENLLSWQELFRYADKAFGGTQAEGVYTPKDAYDAMELAVNQFILKNKDLYSPAKNSETADAVKAVARLKDFIDRLPTQTKRTREQDEYQQFSTPPGLAFIANWVANVNSADTMLEPSAGVGGIAIFAKATDATVVVNELSPRRAALLELLGFDQVFTENAEQIDNILPESVAPTVVIMNPPFSATAGRVSKNKTKYGAQHVEQALARLQPGGRLVAIVGRGMADDRPAFKKWWDRIKKTYNVRANIGISGKDYTKYGTSFDNQILVIDKTGPTDGKIQTGFVEHFTDLPKLLGGVRNDRPAINPQSESTSVQPTGKEVSLPGETAGPSESTSHSNVPGVGAEQTNDSGGRRTGDSEVHLSGEQSGKPDEVSQTGRSDTGEVSQDTGGPAGRTGNESDRSREERDLEFISNLFDQVAEEKGLVNKPAAEKPSLKKAAGHAAKGAKTGLEAVAEIMKGLNNVGSVGKELPPLIQPEAYSKAKIHLTESFNEFVAAGKEVSAWVGHAIDTLRELGAPMDLIKNWVLNFYVKDRPREVKETEVKNVATKAKSDLSDSLYDEYEPKVQVAGSRKHPTKLVQSAAMAAVEAPDIKYKIHLPKSVIEGTGPNDSTGLSDIQLEAVAYAGAAHSTILNNGERKGFFIGDNTGVGKGREIAGIIRDNWEQGRKKAVWISEKWGLAKDAVRDLNLSGWTEGADVLFEGGGKTVKAGQRIKQKQGILFTTYTTLAGGFRTVNEDKAGHEDDLMVRANQLIKWLGKDFDGVIAFDESHNMANAAPQKGARGTTKPAMQALAGIYLQKKLPNARVVYVSATGATEVSNLTYAQRLGLWGEGTEFRNAIDFVNKISSGGLAAMEMVAGNMKALGLYIARSLSYDGVKYNRLTHELTKGQAAKYDELAGAWQIVLQNINDALKVTGGGKMNAQMSMFWGAHQRFFNQIITTLQMPSVIKSIKEDLKAGYSPVLQFVNTDEAAQERALAKLEQGQTLEDLDMTPRDALLGYLESGFPVTQYEEYQDEHGNTRARQVTDSKGNPVLNREAVRMRDELITRIASIKMPNGPIDYLLQEIGHENVAEITGRKRRIVTDPDTGRMKIEKRTDAHLAAEAEDFDNGKRKVLIFSGKGNTGRSYHADKTIKNQSLRRHYLVQPGWRADKAVQGLGRTHRSNQAQPPEFILVTTNLKAQARFLSSIARRLDQLGALTKGQRQTGSQGIFQARDNLESSYAHDALMMLIDDIIMGKVPGMTVEDFETQTGLDISGDHAAAVPTTQFLNRLLSMKIAEQNITFDAFSERMDRIIQAHSDAGTLDVGIETITGDSVKETSTQTIRTDKTGAKTEYVQLDMTNPANIINFDQSENLFQGKGGYYRNIRSGKVWRASPTRSRTTSTGETVGYQMLVSPANTHQRKDVSSLTPDKYESLSKSAAQSLWEIEYESLPKTVTDKYHIITGALLPIWSRLKGAATIYRFQTDDGKRFLGRSIPESQLSDTMRSLDIEAGKTTYTGQQVVDAVISQGARFSLEGHGWSIRNAVVSGEQRIEVTGPEYDDLEWMDKLGVITERINYSVRYFVPTTKAAPKIVSSILKRHPVRSIETKKRGNARLNDALTFARTITEEQYKNPTLLIGQRIEKKYADILSLDPFDEGPLPGPVNDIVSAIDEDRIGPAGIKKYLAGVDKNSLSSDIMAIRTAIADKIGELIETHRYEGYEEGKALEGRIDRMLRATKGYGIPEDVKPGLLSEDARKNITDRLTSAVGPFEQMLLFKRDYDNRGQKGKGRETQDSNRLQKAIAGIKKIPEGMFTEAEAGFTDDTTTAARLLGKLFRKRVVFFKNSHPEIFNFEGVSHGSFKNTIFINAETKRPHLVVAGHEFVHELRRDHPDLYNAFSKEMLNYLQNFGDYKKKYDALTKRDGLKQLPVKKVYEELLADFVGSQMMSSRFWKEFSKNRPSLFHRIATAFINFVDKIISRLSYVDNGTPYFKDLEAARKVAARVMAEYADRGSLGGQSVSSRAAFAQAQAADKWYSQMEKALKAKLPGKSTSAQFKRLVTSWAGKQYKAEELEWSGLIDWLESKTGKITKAEILDYLAENRVQLHEVVKEGDPRHELTVGERDGRPAIINTRTDEVVEYADSYEDARERYNTLKGGGNTKFKRYTTPGGGNYRELLITLPIKPMPSFEEWHKQIHGTDISEVSAEMRLIAKRQYERVQDPKVRTDVFTGQHWEEPNVLAHVRFNERTDVDGNRILFIEEVQSDWHQVGRKKGYGRKKGIYKIKHPDGRMGMFQYDSAEEAQKEIDENPDEYEGASVVVKIHEEMAGVPDAPLKESKQWSLLAMKRMVRYAAENGFDRIAWTPGAIQFERWGSEEIAWEKQGDGWQVFVSEQVGGNAGGVDIENEARIRGLLKKDKLRVNDKDLFSRLVKEILQRDRTEAELNKIIDRTWDRMQVEDIGTSLPRKEGMEGFYDKILPAAINKFFNKKAWGKAKAGEISIDSASDGIGTYSGPTLSKKDLKKYMGKKYSKTIRNDARAVISSMIGGVDFKTSMERHASCLLANEIGGEFKLDKTIKAWSLPITPEMRSKALSEGMPMFLEEPPNFKYSASKDYNPQKTITAYKLFRTLKTKPGKIFPLFIGKTKPTETGTWLKAEFIPTKGFARRPGWHAGILPIAPHLRQVSTGRIDPSRVWAEVEIPADKDWQSVADKRKTKDIQNEIPEDGHYRFRVSKMQGGAWIIGGAIKVKRLLSDSDVATILREAGYSDNEIANELHDPEVLRKLSATAENQRAMDNPAFRKWFKGSKVVDENGDPLVVYHGTRDNFNAFDPSLVGKNTFGNYADTKAGSVIFFADKPWLPSDIAEFGGKEGASVLPLYLSLQNPLIIEKPYYKMSDGAKAIKDAKAKNHDGVIIKITGEGNYTGNIYMAFKPTQVKSIYNRGTFDQTNPDITFALAGSQKVSDVLPDDVAARMKAAKGVDPDTFRNKLARFGRKLKEESFHFPGLSRIKDVKQKAVLKETLRQHQEIPMRAQDTAARAIKGFLAGLSPDEYDLYSMRIILGDEMRCIKDGQRTEKNLPFGFKSFDEVATSFAAVNAMIENNPKVKKAFAKRQAFQRDLAQQLVNMKILKPEILESDEYFHHQVLEYWNAKEAEFKGIGTSSSDARSHWRPWMASRKDSAKDYNTEYAEAELMTIAQMIGQVETAKSLLKIRKEADILKSLNNTAKNQNYRMVNKIAEYEPGVSDPKDDPFLPYRAKIATGIQGLVKMAGRGDLEYDSEFQDVVDALIADFNAGKDPEASHVSSEMQSGRFFHFLSHQINAKLNGSGHAAMIYKSIKARERFIKETLGDNFKTGLDLIPEGYVKWQPDKKKGWFWTNSIADNILEKVVAGEKSLEDKDVRKVLAKGRSLYWVIPEGLADTMDNFRPIQKEGMFGNILTRTMQAWKQYILLNPLSVLKYNINNMSGDLDAVLACDPKIVKYAKQALSDLRPWMKHDPKASRALDEARDLGVIGSGFSVQEVEDTLKVLGTDRLLNDVLLGKKPGRMQKYWTKVKTLTTLRENMLRLAAYRYFLNDVIPNRDSNGALKNYGASNAKEVDALVQYGMIKDAAAKMARELLGDYGAISRHGEYLRSHMIPFYSWLEINTPRYVYLMRNLKYNSGEADGNKAKIAAVLAKRAGVFALKASMLFAAVSLYNGIVWPDEEDELGEAGRRQLHLILGRRKDGSIITLRFQGALSDALSWFGAEDFPNDVQEVIRGKATIGDKLKEAAKASANKGLQGFRPDVKILFESLTGKKLYPDAFAPRPVRDKVENILSTFKLNLPYQWATGRPHRGATIPEQLANDLLGVVLYSTEPGVQAYYDVRRMVFDWQKKNGLEKNYGSPTNKGNALYYYKQAMKYGDLRAAKKYLKKYQSLGGTKTGLKQSIRMIHPLFGIKQELRAAFVRGLSKKEQTTLQRGIEWYRKTYTKQ